MPTVPSFPSRPLRALVGSALLAAVWLTQSAATPAVHCDRIRFQANEATCSGLQCTLHGDAELWCADLRLLAQQIELRRDAAGHFAGATAQGNVMLIQGERVIKAAALELAADRIGAVVDDASLDVYGGPGDPPLSVPSGPRCLTAHGRLLRDAPHHLVLSPGDATLCDCGVKQLPSWRLDSSRVDVDIGERLTLYAPQLRIHLPGTSFMLPVTPPLLPLSLPLRPRATGFLPPLLRFYGGWPTIDLPFFVPLGDSHDLLVSPGLRTDWGRWRPATVSLLGAPRLGLRWRYAPSIATAGLLEAHLTYDAAGQMAANGRAADAARNALAPAALYRRRDNLRQRLRLDWQHRSHFGEALELNLEARWVSDDLLLQDFALATPERFATYWPSRGALCLNLPQWQARLAADVMLRLDNLSRAEDGELLLPAYSNADGSEAGTMHRAPELLVSLLPTTLLPGVLLDASGGLARLAPWGRGAPQAPFTPPPGMPPLQSQDELGGTAGITLAGRLGGLSLALRNGIDALWLQREATAQAAAARQLDAIWVAQADAEITLRRTFAGGGTTHLVRPRLSYRGVPWHHGPTSALDALALGELDERQRRRRGHQVAAVLRQSLLSAAGATESFMLEVGQPVDLRTRQWLQPYAELRLALPTAGSATLFASFDPQPGQPIRWREVAAQWGGVLGPLGWDVTYQRLAPDADRFERGTYELASPRLPIRLDRDAAPGNWVHALRGGGGLRLGGGFSASYRTAVQLPRPGQQGGDVACASPQQRAAAAAASAAGLPIAAARLCFTEHRLSLEYASPCHCWGFGNTLSWVPQDPAATLRMQVVLNLAGLALGT